MMNMIKEVNCHVSYFGKLNNLDIIYEDLDDKTSSLNKDVSNATLSKILVGLIRGTKEMFFIGQ